MNPQQRLERLDHLYRYLLRSYLANGYAPSVREISHFLGCVGSNGALSEAGGWLDKLRQRGLVQPSAHDGHSRSATIPVILGRAWVNGQERLVTPL